MAHDLRLPLVRLVDGTGGGGSVKTLEQMGFTYVPPLPGFDLVGQNHAIVPVVAAALGPVRRAGRRAGRRLALLGDRPGHRPAVRRRPAGGRGGRWASRPTRRSWAARARRPRPGAVDNEADDEEDALEQLRRFLSYLPDNVWEAPPVSAHRPARPPRGGAASRSSRAIARQPYKMRRILERSSTAARSSSSAPRFGPPLITALGAPRRPPGRRARLRPQALRRRPHRGRLREARPLRRPLRPVPPAGRQLRRPAGLPDRHRRRARRHDPPRRPGALRRSPGDRAVGLGPRAQGLRRGGRRRTATARGSTSATPGRRATGARCRSPAASRPPTGASSRPPRTPRRCAPRSRRA